MMRAKHALPALSLVLALVLTAALPAALAAQARAARIKVVAEQANLREKPDIGSAIVQQIPEGTVLEADRKEGEWFFVRYALEDGGVIGGWIHESLVEVVEEARTAPRETVRPADRPAERPARPRNRPKLPPLEFRSGAVPLEISFSLGAATLAPRDLNKAARGFADWQAAATGLTAPGSAQGLRVGPVFGFELSYRLSRAWTVGLGADFLRGSNGQELELTGTGVSATVATKPWARAVPIKALVRYDTGLGFYVRGAIGLYAVKAGYLYRREGGGTWEQWKGSASASGLGGEAAFGGEWELGPRTILFLEAGLRAVGVSGLTGDGYYTNSEGASVREPGPLYQFRQAAGDADYPWVVVRTLPPSGEGVSDVRQARINVSGTAFRVGVRYRF